MKKYSYILQILIDGEWKKIKYDYFPTKEMDKAEDENQVWKLTITKRT